MSIGLFAIVMTLAAGAYLIMISANRRAEAIATGIDNLSFALDEMTRDIRTGTQYSCDSGGDCTQGSQLSLTDPGGNTVTYTRGTQSGPAGTVHDITRNGVPITDPSIDVSTLAFTVFGASAGDTVQERAVIVSAGTVSSGPGSSETFTVETGATMRGQSL